MPEKRGWEHLAPETPVNQTKYNWCEPVVDGSFEGSWKHVPKDLVIACWWYKMRDKSLAFFSKRGFQTLGASYYDATPGAIGIMYATWLNKYKLLTPFGDLVSRR